MTKQEILKVASGITGWMSEDELAWLIEQASTRRTAIEIGSWKGRSTKALALSVQEVVYSVDEWMSTPPPTQDSRALPDWMEVEGRGAGSVKAEFERNLSGEIASGKCIPIGLSSEAAVGKLKDMLSGRKVDMVFIDGDHDYPMVKRDIELWMPMLAEGGLISGHDYIWPTVHKAVAELVPGHRYLHHTTIWYGTAVA